MSAGLEIRTCRDRGELARALACISHYFAVEMSDEQVDTFALLLHDLDRMHVAIDEGEIVAAAGAFGFDVTVPGGAAVPTAGVTVVGVRPTHRRRGLLTALSRAQLDDARRRRDPLAALWASEGTIYGRFGYGIASRQGIASIQTDRAAFARPLAAAGRARFVSLEEALELVPPIYDRVRAATPGMFSRSRAWWEHRRLADREAQRRGLGPLSRVVLELDGEPAAYALYRIKTEWSGAVGAHALHVLEATGTTPAATAAVWRFLLDVDWIATVQAAFLPVDHPLFLLLGESRRLRFDLADALWVRLVDVEAALAARSYQPGAEVVLELADEFCPWNEGHWLVGRHGAERTESPGEIALVAADLASVYLGGFTFAQLVAAGRAQELEPGAAERADALFRSAPAPWCPEIF